MPTVLLREAPLPTRPQACRVSLSLTWNPPHFSPVLSPQPQRYPLPLSRPLSPSWGDGVYGRASLIPRACAADNVRLWVTAPLTLRAPWSLGMGCSDDKWMDSQVTPVPSLRN